MPGFEHGADIALQSLTKYIGGHDTTIGGDRGLRAVRLGRAAAPLRRAEQPDPSCHGVLYTETSAPRPLSAAAGLCRCATQRRCRSRRRPGAADAVAKAIDDGLRELAAAQSVRFAETLHVAPTRGAQAEQAKIGELRELPRSLAVPFFQAFDAAVPLGVPTGSSSATI